MLLSFRVANHKSIKDEQALHLQPVYDKSRPALPVAAIFGANAAGKSNVLDALRFMIEAVRSSFGGWHERLPRSPYQLAPESAETDSAFGVELLLDGVRWAYGFSVDSDRVTAESLYTYPQHRPRLIFKRDINAIKFGTTVSLSRTTAKGVHGLLPPHSLFMSAAGGIFPELGQVHSWFASKVAILASGAPEIDDRRLLAILEDASVAGRFVALARAADVGLADIEVQRAIPAPSWVEDGEAFKQWIAVAAPALDPSISSQELRSREQRMRAAAERLGGKRASATDWTVIREPLFRHGPNRVGMRLRDQSRGTRVWLSYLMPVITALDNGSTLIVDEIDTSLHPRLTAQLISLFREPRVNRLGAQLVFTTHDATLLGRQFGEDILGRDEIWFVEKNQDGATDLYALAEFQPRKDENTERRYLTGSYGAVPGIFEGDFTEALAGNHGETGDRAAS